MSYLPKPGQATAVQIDRDPARLGLRYPIDIGLCGDAPATIKALLPMLQRRPDRSFLEKAQERMKDWWELMRSREERTETPLKPQVVARHVNDLLDDNAIITTDSGTITTWAARHLKIRKGMKFSCSGTLATMAPGLPYANGAQVAFPDRQVVAFVGDGGFAMLMMEFITAVKHKLPIRVIIIKNNTLGQIKWEQMIFLGNPEYGVELQPIDFVKFAEACGGAGFRCDSPENIGPAMKAAFAHPGPVVVEATVDPFEPPMPPRANATQALHFAESLARGEPNRSRSPPRSSATRSTSSSRCSDRPERRPGGLQHGHPIRRQPSPIERVEVSAYKVPTDAPESDGTIAWDHTTLVLVEATAGGQTGLGYSYADPATATLIRESLAEVVRGRDAMGVPGPGRPWSRRSATWAGPGSPRWRSRRSTRPSGT